MNGKAKQGQGGMFIWVTSSPFSAHATEKIETNFVFPSEGGSRASKWKHERDYLTSSSKSPSLGLSSKRSNIDP